MIIYKAINKENNMAYIGQTSKNLENRQKEHIIKSNHTDFYFHRAIKKYGTDNFIWKIIKECENKKEANLWEKYFIKAYDTKNPHGYNMTDGGEGTVSRIIRDETRYKLRIANLGKHPTEETIKKLIKSHLGQKGANKGRIFSKEWREKLSISHKGKKLSEENKKHISEANKGKIGYWKGKEFSEAHRKKLSEANKGKKGYWNGKERSEHDKKKISESFKKLWLNKEYREYIINARRGVNG